MLLSFVIPVYNEQDSLEQLTEEIIANCAPHDYEIIFIDDGSKDHSFTIMEELALQDPNIKVVKFRRNFGKAAALQYGFNLAQGEIVFTLDADLQDNPKEIPKFLDKIAEGWDLVSGWKQKRNDPWHKVLPSRFFNFVTAHAFHLKLKDFNCGFKAYRKEVVKDLNLYGEMHRYIPALAYSLGYKITEIPVEHRKRIYGHSKYGMERYLRGFFDLLTVKMVTQYARSPLYLFGRVGLVATIIGVIIGIYLTILKIFYNQPLSNRPLLFLAITLILGGLQFVSLGLISELIVNRSVPLRPLPVSVEKTVNIQNKERLELESSGKVIS